MSIATPVVAQDNGPVPDQPGGLQPRVYLPAVMLIMPSYTMAGQVKDAQDIPLSGVTVKDISGRTVTTNING
jgi:hypothetical protein